jgi:hypothetical protein
MNHDSKTTNINFGLFTPSGTTLNASKRKARGYRSTTHLITMLYFTAGKLRLSCQSSLLISA